MTAEQDEGGNVPAHDKHTDGYAHDGRRNGIGIAEIFRGQEEGIRTKTFHETAVHHTEHQDPENEQNLVFP
jgi:hypothetical protein